MDIKSSPSDSSSSSGMFGGVTQTPEPKPEPKKSKFKKPKSSKPVMVLVVVLVLSILAGSAYYFYNQSQENKKKYEQAQQEVQKLSNTEQVAKEERDKLVAQVGQLVQLPADETPTIATVTDVSKLKNQAFFADAQNGDKVLIYTKDKTAYLYRPSTNKIITIAPVNIGANQAQNTQKTNP